MASSKVMASSKPKSSDLSSSAAASASTRSKRTSALCSSVTATAASASSSSSSSSSTYLSIKDRTKSINHNLTTSSSLASTMTVDGILRNVYSTPSAESTLLDAQITLMDTPTPTLPTPPPPAAAIETNHVISSSNNQDMNSSLPQGSKTVDDVWREIVAGRKEMKEEPDEMMTLEDFLAKAGAVDVGEEDEVKMPPPERLSGAVYAFDPVPPSAFQVLDKVEGSIVGFRNGVEMVAGGGGSGVGRGKRGRTKLMEPLDKAAQQRQRRMIKNRESAARSRERKQAYQVELESLAVRLEEENDRLHKEKKERTRERRKQLMEKVVPVVEKRKPRRMLRRVQSLQW